jgi:predicted dehydrogenase
MGHLGSLHARAWKRIEGVELVGGYDPDPGARERAESELGLKMHDSLAGLLAGLDALSIAAPTPAHHDVARVSLARGIATLVEKPLASTPDEGEAILALARAQGTALAVGHIERMNPAVLAALPFLRHPRFIEAHRLAPPVPRGTDVDVILDLMIHDLDLALSLARSEVSGVSACGFRVLTNDIDIASARIEFANGCVADLSASRVSQAVVRKFRVFEPGLYASADLQAGKLRYVRQERGEIKETEETHAGGDALAAQAESFVLAIKENGPVAVDGTEGRRVLKLALEIGRLVRERLARFAQ